MNIWLTVGGWAASAVLGWLWLEAREDLAAAHVEHALAVETAARQAGEMAREAERAAAERKIAQERALVEAERKARQSANAAAESAKIALIAHAERIRTLELEAETDEIPDSSACRNAFMPAGVLPDEDSASAGAGGGGGGDSVRADSAGSARADSAFAAITYGDFTRICAKDRATIRILNGRLAAIGELNASTGED